MMAAKQEKHITQTGSNDKRSSTWQITWWDNPTFPVYL